MSHIALQKQSNADLEWNLALTGSRQSAIEFVMHFESRLCVYSASVEQLYTNYTINFSSRADSPMVILPNPYAFHDTYSHVSASAVRDTGLFIIPGETVGKQGLQLISRHKQKNVSAAPIPFRHALKKILATQDGQDPFLPILVKGDLREFDARTPCLHLHRLKLPELKTMSGFERQSIKRAINQKLYVLYKHADRISLTRRA